MDEQTHVGGVYNISYHFVWCPKFRRPVLTGGIHRRLRALIEEKVAELEGTVLALEAQPDHVHLFVQMPPKWSPAEVAFRLKGYTSHALRREYPSLRRRLPSLWSRSYYVGTAGNVSAETIRRYIEAQKGR
jgi:putative transposase